MTMIRNQKLVVEFIYTNCKMEIKRILNANFRINQIINSFAGINEEELYLTGGALRNAIWNNLHGFDDGYELEDCDIIFYNPNRIDKSYEKLIEQKLNLLNPIINWSVKNQARMHLKNGHLPYNSIEDALKAFPDTVSAVAIDKYWNTIAPYGLSDLFNLSINETNYCHINEIGTFNKRVVEKDWLTKWPKLKLSKKVRFTTTYIAHSWAVA